MATKIKYGKMKRMGKLKKFLSLTDPPPNLRYELSCYLKAILGMIFLILGVLFIFHPLLIRINIFGILETGLTPTGVKIINLFGKTIFPKGYFGFLILGMVSVILGVFCFLRIKLIKKLLKQI